MNLENANNFYSTSKFSNQLNEKYKMCYKLVYKLTYHKFYAHKYFSVFENLKCSIGDFKSLELDKFIIFTI